MLLVGETLVYFLSSWYESNCFVKREKKTSASGQHLPFPPLSLTHLPRTYAPPPLADFCVDHLPAMLRTATARASFRVARPQRASKSFFSTTSASAALSPYSRSNTASRNKLTEVPRNQSTTAAAAAVAAV